MEQEKEKEMEKEMERKLEIKVNRRSKKKDKWRQMAFNITFLRRMRRAYKNLHCVYCGKKNLRIYSFWEKAKNREDMATVDHVIPKSQMPDLAYDYSNLEVACDHCNRKKGIQIWEIKYPYPKKGKIKQPKKKKT